MSEWKNYRRIGSIEMRPHYVGEDLVDISVSDIDMQSNIRFEGGMIARSESNPHDMWYVNKKHFADNYDPNPDSCDTEEHF